MSTAQQRDEYVLEQVGGGLREDILESRFRTAFKKGGHSHITSLGRLIEQGKVELSETDRAGRRYYAEVEDDEELSPYEKRFLAKLEKSKGNPMRPKGHKRGCKCVVCSHKRNPRHAAKKRAVKRNHGYENQMLGPIRRERKALGKARPIKRNSTIRIPNPGGWHIFDLYDGRGRLVRSDIKRCDKATAKEHGQGYARTTGIAKVDMTGPYPTRPVAGTARK